MTELATRPDVTDEDVEERAKALLRNDVYYCQSSLVDGLLMLSGAAGGCLVDGGEVGEAFSWDEVENLHPDPSDWTVSQCREYLDIHRDGHEDLTGLDDYRAAISDLDPKEVLEWWLISEQLARELDELDQPLLRNKYGDWWGRTCSGQTILLDGTLQDVARLILSR
jgi:hypothetical protein